MRILLDECIDRRLAKEFKGHTVKTVPQMGWATIKNGRLLALAEADFRGSGHYKPVAPKTPWYLDPSSGGPAGGF